MFARLLPLTAVTAVWAFFSAFAAAALLAAAGLLQGLFALIAWTPRRPGGPR